MENQAWWDASKRINLGPGPGSGIPPVFNTEALEALIVERVAAAISLYDSQRSDGSDPWDSTRGSGGNPRPCSYKHFMNCKPQILLRKRGRHWADSMVREDGSSLSDKLLCTRRPDEVCRLYFCKHCTILVEWTHPDDWHHRSKLHVMGRVKSHDVRRVLPKKWSTKFGIGILESHYERLGRASLYDPIH